MTTPPTSIVTRLSHTQVSRFRRELVDVERLARLEVHGRWKRAVLCWTGWATVRK